MRSSAELTEAVKQAARNAGFARVRIAPADEPVEVGRFQEWLRRGWCADMRYLGAHLETRRDVRRLVAGARSVICLAAGYFDARGPAAAGPAAPLVARYAWGADYHDVLRKHCRRLMVRLGELDDGFQGRAFVDSGPVMERSLAARAGLGWIGRNGCLVVPGLGSYVFLCEIICSLPLVPDEPLDGRCGDCDACLRACPTGALAREGLVDARRCVSYLTVECRGGVPPDLWPQMGCRVFGCDRCQEACPHNRGLPAGDAELLAAGPVLGGASLAEVLRWSADDWDAATRGSACRRATHEMFLRNAAIAAGHTADPALAGPLRVLAGKHPGLSAQAAWALTRLAEDRPGEAGRTTGLSPPSGGS